MPLWPESASGACSCTMAFIGGAGSSLASPAHPTYAGHGSRKQSNPRRTVCLSCRRCETSSSLVCCDRGRGLTGPSPGELPATGVTPGSSRASCRIPASGRTPAAQCPCLGPVGSAGRRWVGCGRAGRGEEGAPLRGVPPTQRAPAPPPCLSLPPPPPPPHSHADRDGDCTDPWQTGDCADQAPQAPSGHAHHTRGQGDAGRGPALLLHGHARIQRAPGSPPGAQEGWGKGAPRGGYGGRRGKTWAGRGIGMGPEQGMHLFLHRAWHGWRAMGPGSGIR